MNIRRVITIVVLLVFLSSGVVAIMFFRWLGSQPEAIDTIDLTNQINERRNYLSTVQCSTDIVSDLELLLADQETFLEQIDIADRENYYFDLVLTHAKLAYIYELEGSHEISEKHYSTAEVYVDLGTTNVDGTEFVRRIARNSTVGCIPL